MRRVGLLGPCDNPHEVSFQSAMGTGPRTPVPVSAESSAEICAPLRCGTAGGRQASLTASTLCLRCSHTVPALNPVVSHTLPRSALSDLCDGETISTLKDVHICLYQRRTGCGWDGVWPQIRARSGLRGTVQGSYLADGWPYILVLKAQN